MSNPAHQSLHIPLISELAASGDTPEYLFWVGCAGSFDSRAQRITQAMVKILNHLEIDFAVLGQEESCTGDPAKRSGNEFLFQMQAMQNIETLNMYQVKKIITACPHCFNTLKNEYPDLGGNYEVIHHSQLLQEFIDDGKLRIDDGKAYQGKKITFHDSCYLGRANGIYEAPRSVVKALDADLSEMKRSRSKGLCCGAGGAQVFKDAEKGRKEVNTERAEEAIATGANVVAMNCPFCMVMFQDAVKKLDKENDIELKDIAEIAAENL
jgi:Fe-S oxidoreductase